MLFFLLSSLLRLTLVTSSIITLPSTLQNETVPTGFPSKNLSIIETDPLSSSASILDDLIDPRLKPVYHVYPDVPLSGTSAYMNVLKAMIELSLHDYTHRYNGGDFSFKGYTNVKVLITRISPESSTLQYRFAILGLYRTVIYMSANNMFKCILVDLYWTENGSPELVGHITISPDPLPDIVRSNNNNNNETQDLIDLTRRSQIPAQPLEKISNTTTTSLSPLNARGLSVYLQLQGTKLNISAIFKTIFTALLHIASFPSLQTLEPFTTKDWSSHTELRYELHGNEPRTSPPYFTYQYAALALGKVPAYMFAQRRFEDVTFVVEVMGVPVGQGFLRGYGDRV